MLQKLKSRKGNHVDNNVAYYKKKRSNTNIPTFMTSQSPTKVNVMVSSDRIHHPFKTNAFPNLDHAKNISGGFGDIFKIGELEQFRDEFINISKNNRTQVFNPRTFKISARTNTIVQMTMLKANFLSVLIGVGLLYLPKNGLKIIS